MDKIADVVKDMYTLKGEQYEELIFDDKAVLAGSLSEQGTVAEIKDDAKPKSAETVDTLIKDESK
jgi:hypothetical protein